ncbi:penicillin-binding protein activator [Parvibaculum sp.]|uniref:penicillin-binding protein activator n=1 Tax=Parvibaculum sp. TaxID=2024848 RepID=UPI0025F989B6|nr:penicillin-binding protein activator [Parvibaculum sp.]
MHFKISAYLSSARHALRPALFVLGALALAGCSGTPKPVAQAPVQPQPQVQQPVQQQPEHLVERNPANYYSPPFLPPNANPVRIAVILPFNNSRAQDLANALYNAAQLALFEFDRPNVLMMPKATDGSAGSAERAARQALEEGADIILGPLFSAEVQAVKPLAADTHVPVLAFSSDLDVAGDGVHLLSFPPSLEVDRIVDYTVLQGKTRFAALYPQSAFGDRVRTAFNQAVAARAGTVVASAVYPRNAQGMYAPVKQIARAYDGGNGFDAVFMPEGGSVIKSLAPLLPYNDVDPRQVQFIGTGQWDDPSLTREPPLQGGLFAAPPLEAHKRFVERYRRAYGATPPRLASLAYDAAGLAIALSARGGGNPYSEDVLTDPEGFSGVDGVFRFLPDGGIERGLAVMQITASGLKQVDPAPTGFAPAPAF